MSPQTVIETKELSKYYGPQAAVDNLTLQVQEGEIFGFLGPNGAGKTTTILMLLGLTEPSKGEARVCGFNPIREPLKVKRLVGYLPENMGFYRDMTARENLLYVARLNKIPNRDSSQKIVEALEIVGLSQEAEVNAWASRKCSSRIPRSVSSTSPPWGWTPMGPSG
jgi:ABC-2 type transport system ATP-binding protein